LRSISGVRTLTGQHCAPLVGDTRLVNVHRMLKHHLALFGQNFGFSAPGTWDGINFRQRSVDDAEVTIRVRGGTEKKKIFRKKVVFISIS